MIQNLLDEGAKHIDVEVDSLRHQIRIRGDARPITQLREARRIFQSICASKKVGKLGEKGVGMLSFVTIGKSMTTLSHKGGRVVWVTLDRDNLGTGRVGSKKGNPLPYAGTEIRISGVSPKNLKYRFSKDRVIKDIKRRWGSLLGKGIEIGVNGRDVVSFVPPLEGERFERTIRAKELSPRASIDVSLLILAEPSDLASVNVTHLGQANFLISDVPIFDGHNAFTQGMLHGAISGDIAPINASRTGFQETKEFEVWLDKMLDLEEELGRIIEERIRTSAEARDAAMLDEWMQHLKDVFKDSELASTVTSSGRGDEEGWQEVLAGEGCAGGGEPGRKVGQTGRKGGTGRLPTVPYAGFTKAPPNIRVVRERKAFRINVNHPDFVLAAKSKRGRRQYIRELCMHEAYTYSLDGKQRDWCVDRSDEFLGYWTRAFVARARDG
ncbi:MAG: hypothetical protein JSW71_22860 [Gemmatimonadota bacterium]|nr:MAG: hypothetical protein JSW71_22860 [Gemmatimonadota bacterium]